MGLGLVVINRGSAQTHPARLNLLRAGLPRSV
jgi:hypothetical protein